MNPRQRRFLVWSLVSLSVLLHFWNGQWTSGMYLTLRLLPAGGLTYYGWQGQPMEGLFLPVVFLAFAAFLWLGHEPPSQRGDGDQGQRAQ